MATEIDRKMAMEGWRIVKRPLGDRAYVQRKVEEFTARRVTLGLPGDPVSDRRETIIAIFANIGSKV